MKQTNIIFLEHQRLKERDSVLMERIKMMDTLMTIYNGIDSINARQIAQYQLDAKIKDQKIDKLSVELAASKKKTRKRNRVIAILSASLAASLGCLFIK